MTAIPPGSVPVTQADREAAADLIWPAARDGSIPDAQLWHRIKSGGDDEHRFVQAFARHRSATAVVPGFALVAKVATEMAEEGVQVTPADREVYRRAGDVIYGMPYEWLHARGLTSDDTHAEAHALYAIAETRHRLAAASVPAGFVLVPEVEETAPWQGERPERLCEAIAQYWAEWEENRAGTGVYLPEELAEDAGDFATGLFDKLAALPLAAAPVAPTDQEPCCCIISERTGDILGGPCPACLNALAAAPIPTTSQADVAGEVERDGEIYLVEAARDLLDLFDKDQRTVGYRVDRWECLRANLSRLS